jgi:protein TonB
VAAPIPDIVPPQIRLPELPLAPAAGLDSRAGAATRDDNGSAAGGRGIGAGLGAAGAGTGGGGTTRARRIAGNISRRDYPRIHADDRVASSVTLRLHISADGRVQDCDILRPSGNPERDAITCRLAIQRFRYEPARDAAGRAIADVAGWRQDWFANE